MTIYDKSKFASARTDKKLSQKTVAADFRITPEYLSMIENGHRQPSQNLILKMSELYGKPVNYFLKNNDIQANTKPETAKPQ